MGCDICGLGAGVMQKECRRFQIIGEKQELGRETAQRRGSTGFRNRVRPVLAFQ